jgi:hypothetical protein
MIPTERIDMRDTDVLPGPIKTPIWRLGVSHILASLSHPEQTQESRALEHIALIVQMIGGHSSILSPKCPGESLSTHVAQLFHTIRSQSSRITASN